MLFRTSKDKEHPYVMLNKTFLDDSNLSLKAKGLLAYCMSKPDDWQFHISYLATVLKEGRDAIYAGFQELIKYGYCIRTQSRKEKGTFQSVDYVLYEVPFEASRNPASTSYNSDNPQSRVKSQSKRAERNADYPDTENPYTDYPDTENPTLLSNNIRLSNDKINIAQTPPNVGASQKSSSKVKTSDIFFSFDSKKFENISSDDMNAWKEVYPSIDVDVQIKKAIDWCLSNPQKAKSKKLWRKFLSNWFNSANEKAVNQDAYRASRGNSSYTANKQTQEVQRPTDQAMENRKSAQWHEYQHVSKSCNIAACSNYVEFANTGSGAIPEIIAYDDPSFATKFEHLIRKYQFVDKSKIVKK